MLVNRAGLVRGQVWTRSYRSATERNGSMRFGNPPTLQFGLLGSPPVECILIREDSTLTDWKKSLNRLGLPEKMSIIAKLNW